VVSFTHQPLYPQGKSPWYSLDRRLGEPQSWSGYDGVEKNSQTLSGLKPPIIQPVAQCYTTGLAWLLFITSLLILIPCELLDRKVQLEIQCCICHKFASFLCYGKKKNKYSSSPSCRENKM
jgi:hypothetical protein